MPCAMNTVRDPLARAITLGPALRASLDRFGISTDPVLRAAVVRVIARLGDEPCLLATTF